MLGTLTTVGAITLVLLGLSGFAAEPATVWTLELGGVLDGGRPLVVYGLEQEGRLVHAAALSPKYNRAVHAVAFSQWTSADAKCAGKFSITVNSDGYAPKDGRSLQGDLSFVAAIKDRQLAGTFEGTFDGKPAAGTVTGSAAPAPATPAVGRLALAGENVLQSPGGKKGLPRRLTITMGLDKGEGFLPKAEPPGSLVDVSCAPMVTVHKAQLVDNVFAFAATIVNRQQSGTESSYSIEGAIPAFGDRVIGTVAVKSDGKDLEPAQFIGQIVDTSAIKPGDAQWVLTLPDLLGPGAFAKLHLLVRDGKVIHGFGVTPNYNNSIHKLDVRELKLDGDRLKGPVNLTIVPDAWIPKDHKPVDCPLVLDVKTRLAECDGTVAGKVGEAVVKGAAIGLLAAHAQLAADGKVTLKLEDALQGGNPYVNRVFVGMDLVAGKVTGGRLTNNHTKLDGTLEQGTLTLKDDTFEFSGTASVTTGGVTPGKYTFRAKGPIIGSWAVGEFESSLEGSPRTKTGTFWCALPTVAKP